MMDYQNREKDTLAHEDSNERSIASEQPNRFGNQEQEAEIRNNCVGAGVAIRNRD